MASSVASSVEEDYRRLHREYQFLEQNRKDYAKDSANIIARQQRMIEQLKADSEALKLEYRNYMAKPRSSSAEATLQQLQEHADAYAQKLALEKKSMEELRQQNKIMRDKIFELRKKMGGINAAKENQRMVQKQIRILENRLDKALVKFNEALAVNKELRQQIDSLRRERVVFDNIYRKLERELHEKKKQMANIIEASNQAYEARDQAQMEIAAIEQQNSREQAEYEGKVAELQTEIERERVRRDEMTAAERGSSATRRGEGAGEDDRLHRHVTRAAWNVAKDRASMQVSMEKVQSYEEAWIKIKAATGIEDINELVKIFIMNEDQNFSLFNYVNEQNNEIEKLEEQIAELRGEEHKYAQESGEDVHQHKQLISELEAKLDQTNAAAQKYEAKFQDAQRTINALKVGIQSIFNKLECNASAMSEMLSGEAVTDANMMQYLGMIEQRTNEVLQLWALLQRRAPSGSLASAATAAPAAAATVAATPAPATVAAAAEAEGADSAVAARPMAGILGQGPVAPTGEQKLQIAPPAMDEYSDVEGEDSDSDSAQLPHKLDQIKSDVLRYMSQKNAREQRARGRGGSERREPRRRVHS